MILILGGMDDEHARHMLDYLQQRGADVELLDSRWFPSQLGIEVDPVGDAGTFHIPGGRAVPFAQVQAVYWRCYNSTSPPPVLDVEQAYIAANDARSLFESVLIRLRTRWVNGWNAYQLHQTKPVQLARVAALGVPVPATLLTNRPDAVRAFAAAHPRCIFKPIQGGAYTRRVTVTHLMDDNLRSLGCAPVTLQEEISGTNIRVFVAGERVLACESLAEALDYREDEQAGARSHRLPPEVEGQCLRIAHELELLWTGIDMRRTPEGRYVFLEANPSPWFLGFEERTGLPLTESLAALLTGE
jgi:glutathione synthase/RimK-type ligase-like ATP-grasp enzyme